MTALIPLSRGLFATIDDCDLERVSAHKWYARPARSRMSKHYAYRSTNRRVDGVRVHTQVYLHRFILGAGAGDLVDHINGDPLDNRRCNLRFATPRQNCINRPTAARHGFRGIAPRRVGWAARICVHRRNIVLGTFATKDEAARAYDAAARIHFGEFAQLNFPTNEARP